MAALTYIKGTPCRYCDSLGREYETGAYYCKASPYGDCECDKFDALAEVDALAGKVIEAWMDTPHVDDAVAEKYIGATADVLHDLVADLGGDFDDELFVDAATAPQASVKR